MADPTDLAVYLSTGRCIAWIGAGPSVEIGLPDWNELASLVLQECKNDNRAGLQPIEDLYQQGKFPEMFDRVRAVYGHPFLLGTCSNALKDSGLTGTIYSDLAKLGFLSYFTTNYDTAMERHLELSGRAVQKYLNSDADLAAVDIDTLPALVKLHGEFSDSNSIVLTKADYQNWYQDGRKEAFQTFLKAHLTRDRILFVGYSLTEPEMIAIQERLSTNLRRSVTCIALLPNVTEDEADSWRTYYNIDVLSYRASGNDHSELHAILDATAKVLALGQVAPVRPKTEDLKKLQALFLWHRFAPARAGEAPVDALQSVILKLALDAGGAIDLPTLLVTLGSEMSLESSDLLTNVKSALQRLVTSDWLEQEGDRYHVPEDTRLTIDGFERRFTDMMSVFRKQALMDMTDGESIPEPIATQLTDAAIDTLIDIFEIRGREIVGMIFRDSPPHESDVLDLLETIWTRANTLDDSNLKLTLVRFLLDLLSGPTGIYVRVLDYLARAFFCIQALRIDANVGKIVSDVMSNRALLIDANVLIPLTAGYEDRHAFVNRVLEVVGKADIPLYTTMEFVDELRRHVNWALQLAENFGPQSVEVLQASKGEGSYDANAYLRGFVNWSTEQKSEASVSMRDYLHYCFGAPYTRQMVSQFLLDRYAIRVVPGPVVKTLQDNHEEDYQNCLGKLSGWNAERPAQSQKSPQRVESETDAFMLICHWREVLSGEAGDAGAQCTYLSLGSSLPRLRRTLGKPPGILWMSPQAIWEVLSRLESGSAGDMPDFRSLMLTSYFRLSGHFLDTSRYRSYFRPLIDASKREYLEHRKILESVLEVGLHSDLLDQYPEEDWPVVVRSLTESANHKASVDRLRIAELSKDKEELATLLEGYREKERKRKRYVQRQRELQRKRRTGR